MDITSLFSLKGKTALITGTRKGLGRAIAVGLASAGAEVIIHGHHNNLAETEAEVHAVGGLSHRWVADLSRTDELENRIDDLLETRRIDILVNNAATFVREPALEIPLTRWREVQAVNVESAWILCQRIGSAMVTRRAGKIINIGSLASLQGGLNRSAYTASKHAIAGITKALSNEWAGSGVQVNAIIPGYFHTGRPSPAFDDPIVAARIPAGRFGEPTDLVGSTIFLSSKAAEYVSGHLLVVDGGWYAR